MRRISFRQLPVGVIQICLMQPEFSMRASVKVVLDLITTLGLSFHPLPSSLAGPAPVPVVALPPSPFAPVKFSGLIERDTALDKRYKLFMFTSIPLKELFCWANVFNEPKMISQIIILLFI